jgi:hypothetical protein
MVGGAMWSANVGKYLNARTARVEPGQYGKVVLRVFRETLGQIYIIEGGNFVLGVVPVKLVFRLMFKFRVGRLDLPIENAGGKATRK